MHATAAKLEKPSGLRPFIKVVRAYGGTVSFTRIVRLVAILQERPMNYLTVWAFNIQMEAF